MSIMPVPMLHPVRIRKKRPASDPPGGLGGVSLLLVPGSSSPSLGVRRHSSSSVVSPPSATISDAPNTPSPSNLQTPQIRPGPRQPTNFSEWQLLAVLHRANLVQYFDTFIAQGGDDINQIMQCDEAEFLEIMSLVGMLSKPLHVRRLQRTLTDFSKDPSAFNLAAVQSIGPPPVVSPYGLAPADAAALQFLLPGAPATSTHSATANVLAGELISSLVASSSAAAVLQQASASLQGVGVDQPGPSGLRPRPSSASPATSFFPLPSTTATEDFVALGDFDPNVAPPSETPVLSDAQIRRLAQCAVNLVARLPHAYKPKLVQNKKKISKELLDVMATPTKIDEYRKYSAIYGRFDAKRKPDKPLTLHEVSVNEAAAQICMLQPALLTRRDELFPLARQAVKDAGYHYVKGMRREGDPSVTSRKRLSTVDVLSDRSSPHSSVSSSPCPEEEPSEDAPSTSASSAPQEPSRKRPHRESNGDSSLKAETGGDPPPQVPRTEA